MENKLYLILSFALVVALIWISFYNAKRITLTCSNCSSKKLIKTGNRRDIERSRQALIASPMPSEDIEYKCQDCGTIKWSVIESIASP